MKLKMNILVLGAVLLAGCSQTQHPVDLSPLPVKKAAFEVGQVVEKNLAGSIRLPGVLKPYDEVNIFPKVSGFVKEVLVDRGSRVKKGQLLVRLEAPELLSAYEAANSRYVQSQESALASKEKYDRLKEAAQEAGAVSPIDLFNARAKMKADYAVSMAELSNRTSMKTMQSYLAIRAPFDGVITMRTISEGALVGAGGGKDQPMLVLQNLQKLRLEVFVPEVYVDKVNFRQEAGFVLNALPGHQLHGKISRSSDALGSLHSEAIEIDIQNKGFMFKPGMYGEVQIPLVSEATSLLVPDNAIVRSTERKFVAKVVDGKALLINVNEGLSSHDSTEVFGDLHARDHIILHANDELKPGLLVNTR